MKSSNAQKEADNFLNDEKQFHLGMLPTEQSNPKTRNLDLKFAENVGEGVRVLLSVDRDVSGMAKRILAGKEFQDVIEAGVNAVTEGRKIIFSGCGATGRLSILLEAMWRYFFRDLSNDHPEIYKLTKIYEDSVISIMTGGDYALIRSVEFFEDYEAFGRQQVKEKNLNSGDVLIAITEGGETSSVLGTIAEAADRGARVFLLFNNPADILVKHIERSRAAIEDPRVTVLDLYCGPMALAGSTRMQATTSEQLIAGAALETILNRCIESKVTDAQFKLLNINNIKYAEEFDTLLDELLAPGNTEMLADFIKLELGVYQQEGLVTYFADNFLMDIFTDTTERSPTFMLPPFKKCDDRIAPPSWAFVKYPLLPTSDTWNYVLGRNPRCLEWKSPLYKEMGASDSVVTSPPELDSKQIVKFLIGNEIDNTRLSKSPNLAINIIGRKDIASRSYDNYKTALDIMSSKYQRKTTLIIGQTGESGKYRINCNPISSSLGVMEHLAVKLILNTISTGTMVLLGRVTGNWMSWVDVTNKKLKDRGIRLISEICGLSYAEACYALHETLEELRTNKQIQKEKFSPVQYTIQKYSINRS